jgi:hypothetical protein
MSSLKPKVTYPWEMRIGKAKPEKGTIKIE